MYTQNISLSQLKDQIVSIYEFSGEITIKLIKYSENINYLISDPMSQKKYALRLCKPDYHDYEELEGEMKWIAQIKNDTDIIVANPIKGLNHQLVQTIELFDENAENTTSQEYHCCMFSFLEGTNLRDICDSAHLRKYNREIGIITAKLHLQVENWNEAEKLKRFKWDLEDLLGSSPRWGRWQDYEGITEHQREVYTKAEEIIKQRLVSYGKGKDRYGLIHTDLNLNNIIVNEDLIQVLDFDDCGFGWFLYDCSTSLLEYEDNLKEMLDAWLEGYESIRALSEEDKAEIMTFIMMRQLVRLAWIGTHSDNDTVKKIPESYYIHTEKLGERFCKTQNMNDFFENL